MDSVFSFSSPFVTADKLEIVSAIKLYVSFDTKLSTNCRVLSLHEFFGGLPTPAQVCDREFMASSSVQFRVIVMPSQRISGQAWLDPFIHCRKVTFGAIIMVGRSNPHASLPFLRSPFAKAIKLTAPCVLLKPTYLLSEIWPKFYIRHVTNPFSIASVMGSFHVFSSFLRGFSQVLFCDLASLRRSSRFAPRIFLVFL